jgi:hypothetical protein
MGLTPNLRITATSDSSSRKAVDLSSVTHNEAPIFIPTRIDNERCSPAGVHAWDAAPGPDGFGEIVSDHFPKTSQVFQMAIAELAERGRFIRSRAPDLKTTDLV